LTLPAEDDLAGGVRQRRLPVAHVLDAGRAPPLEADPAGERAGDHGQVRARERGAQEGARGAPAQPVLLGELVEARAVLAGPVEVGVRGHAGLARGGHEHLGERMAEAVVGHVERAAAAVVAVLHPLVVLGLPEVRQYVLVAPALVAARGPVVVVRGVTPDVDHVVDRAGPAERPPPRPREAPQVAVRLGHRAVAPVVRAVRQEAHHRGGVDERRGVGAARLEQQHGDGRIGGEPIGEDAAGGASADDHVVVHG